MWTDKKIETINWLQKWLNMNSISSSEFPSLFPFTIVAGLLSLTFLFFIISQSETLTNSSDGDNPVKSLMCNFYLSGIWSKNKSWKVSFSATNHCGELFCFHHFLASGPTPKMWQWNESSHKNCRRGQLSETARCSHFYLVKPFVPLFSSRRSWGVLLDISIRYHDERSLRRGKSLSWDFCGNVEVLCFCKSVSSTFGFSNSSWDALECSWWRRISLAPSRTSKVFINFG